MIAGLKPYPSMKDSGVPWVGAMPAHWDLRRTKTLLRERVQKGFPDEPLLAATQTKGVVTKEQYENRTVLALKDLHLLKLVRRGDFVISLRSFQGGIEYAREQGIISPAYTILYPVHRGLHGYLAWLFKSRPYVQNLSLYITGIRQGQNIDYEKLGRAELPMPPYSEQAAIVRFLDHADRRIRRYIRAKQRLIKLLEEQKQAIIHRAVTRGLDPNVRLKPSGVEWLGDVPEHWQMRRLKDLSPRISGRLVYQPAQYFSDEGLPFIMGNNITPDGIRWLGVKRIPAEINARFAHHALREGDVVTMRVGAPGVTCVVPKEADGLNCGSLMIVRRSSRFDSRWLAYVMNSKIVRTQIAFVQYGAAQEQINIEDAVNFRIPVPPLDEQARIGDALLRETEPLSSVAQQCDLSIARMREYRAHLTADVVTGKLDVREAAARLPEEVGEPEPLDESDAEIDAEESADDIDTTPVEVEA